MSSPDQSSPAANPRRVVIAGGGITGLTAAYRLQSHAPDTHITVIDAAPRVGGQIRAIDVAGFSVDVGAESIHLGAPGAASLVRQLGLEASVVSARPGTSLLLTRKGLRPLPAGVGPTGPTKVAPVLKSGILSPLGLVRAGMEPLMRRRYPDDISVADFVQQRFGQEVAETFVDPLLGNLHSGNVHALSLHATAPQLRPIAANGESLLRRALRKTPPRPATGDRDPLPMFASWPGGLTTLVDALVAAITPGVELVTNTTIQGLTRDDSGWLVDLGERQLRADDVIVALPPREIDRLVTPHAQQVGVAMRWVRTASVATVVLAYRRSDAAANEALRDANGLLLTSRQVGVMKAMTNLSRKWAAYDAAEHHIIRVSVGRSTSEIAQDLSDAEMIDAVTRELAELISLTATPVATAVARWPQTMPQLGVGHLKRLAEARSEIAATAPGLHLAGAAIDGLGLTSTIASGLKAADAVAARI